MVDKETEQAFEIIGKFTTNNRNLITFGIIIGLLAIAFFAMNQPIQIVGTNGLTTNVTVVEIRNYFLHDDLTNNTDINNSTYTPYSSQVMRAGIDLNEPIEYTNVSNIANGNTSLVNWTSPIMNITLMPHGIHTLHLHALKIGTGGAHVLKIFYECGTVNATGYNLSIRGTSEFSTEITSTLPYTEFDLDMMMPDISVNSTDRMIVRVWANQTGTGNLPNLQITYDDNTDSRLEFPTLRTSVYKNGLLKNVIYE